MANVGHIEVEVRPTVTLESAAACVTMLNLFLAGNDDYALYVGEDGRVTLCATGGVYSDALSGMKNYGSPSNMTDDERERLARAVMKSIEDMDERMA